MDQPHPVSAQHPPPARPAGLGALADALRALEPSCGPVRLVAVDGHAGSGKSTLAGHLSAATGGAPVLHLDDLATHDEMFDWTDRFHDQVLTPLAHGRTARYGVYDWVRRGFTRREELPPAPLVIVEGVGSGRCALRPYLARLLWLEVPEHRAWKRGRRRDGPGLSGFWDAWTDAERKHFAEDPSRPYADALVRQGTEGYVVLPGPAATA